MRQYLAQLRDEAAIYIKPGYEDSAATAAEKHPSITFSAYTPPTAKKKRKVERTRFSETTHTFRQKSEGCRTTAAAADQAIRNSGAGKASNDEQDRSDASMKPGKKEKIRFGKAPQETLPPAPASQTEDAGAGDQVSATRMSRRIRSRQYASRRRRRDTAIVPSCPSSRNRRDRNWIPRRPRRRMQQK